MSYRIEGKRAVQLWIQEEALEEIRQLNITRSSFMRIATDLLLAKIAKDDNKVEELMELFQWEISDTGI